MAADRLTFPKGFLIFAVLLLGVICVVDNINGRFWLHDFQVYYTAAQSLWRGEPPYGVPFGLNTGFYKYSPFVLLLFTPHSLLPYKVACFLHFATLSACAIAVVVLLQGLIRQYVFDAGTKHESLLLSLGLVFIVNHLFRDVHMGNVNVLLLLLASGGILYVLRGRPAVGGALVALTIAFKPYFLLLLLPLVFHRRIRALASVFATLALLFLLPALFVGFLENVQLHQAWLRAMGEHSDYLGSHHTFAALLQRYVYAGLPPMTTQYGVIVLVAGLYAFLFWQHERRSAVRPNPTAWQNKHLVVGYFVLLALIPNLVITDTEHFLWLLPLILLLLNYLFAKKSTLAWVRFVALMLLYGANSSDLVGGDNAHHLDELGLLGLSNLAIVVWVIYLYYRLPVSANTGAEVITPDYQPNQA